MRKSILIILCSLQLLACSHKNLSVHNLSGRVTCEAKPLEGVVVSDGRLCTQTNSNGEYYLQSGERFVYVSTPAGFLPECKDTRPIYYKEISKSKDLDFALTRNPKDDYRHAFILEADVQAHSAEHWKQYAEVSKEYQETKALYDDRDFFALNCGDIGWDSINSFYPQYMGVVKDFGFPIYRSIGNHDMNYTNRSHESSYQSFETWFGPSTYSFNRGKAHYIVLNNCFYFGRDYFYMGYVDEKTLSWMEQDLSYVPNDAPIFIICHIAFRLTSDPKHFDYNSYSIGAQTVNINAVLDIYKNHNLYILSGHTHSNANMSYSTNAVEHNTAAVCGAWWGGDLCLDGAPQGYGLYEVDGTNVTWKYKGFGKDFDYQLRAYSVGTYEEYPDEVIANVWNYDPLWKVELLEDGKPGCEMTRFDGFDKAVAQMCIDRKDKLVSWVAPEKTAHLFRAKPSKPSAKLSVRATDRFGNVYIAEVN